MHPVHGPTDWANFADCGMNCRYIGVLNVTFSKGPKPSKHARVVGDKGTKNGHGQVFSGTLHSNGSIEPSHDPTALPCKPQEVAEPLRIVSQSQQVGEVPRVILDQNRHIVPFSLFGSPRRPRSADPHHAHLKGSLSPFPQDGFAASDTANDSRSAGGSPTHLRLPEHSASWGTTTVNSKLREQVLREVFGPPLIHHHKKHAKDHNTLPRLRTRSHRKTNQSEAQHDSRYRNASISANEWRAPGPNDAHTLAQQQEGLLTANEKQASANVYSASPSEFEELTRGLEKVKTTSSIESQQSAGSPNSRLRRRHSGMGLRRRRSSVSGNVKGNLEYFEDEGYGGDGEEEVFRMEGPSPFRPGSLSVPTSALPQDLKTPTGPSETTEGSKADSRLRPADLGSQHLPLNPKEAQTQNPDQRVEFFLLLEDLTAGMGRPCVLDLKMGTRQYGIDANKKKMESQRRKCKTTTSQQLGVRICGMQTYNVKKQEPAYEDKYFGRDVKAGREFRDALTRFLYDGISYSSVSRHIPTILNKISKLENMVRRLPGYRFYASSLLMLYDAEPQKSQKAIDEAQKLKGEGQEGGKSRKDNKWPPPIELKIVDFANCVAGEDEIPAEAPCPPHHPNDIDRGYLKGLRTLRMYFLRILRDINQEEYVERGEGEGMAIGPGAGKQGPPEAGIQEDIGEVSI
jgi:inositol-hexakisphosphate 5-kinase